MHRIFKAGKHTLGFFLGLSCASFLAAASIAEAADNSSCSAITLGSFGSTQSEPERWDVYDQKISQRRLEKTERSKLV